MPPVVVKMTPFSNSITCCLYCLFFSFSCFLYGEAKDRKLLEGGLAGIKILTLKNTS